MIQIHNFSRNKAKSLKTTQILKFINSIQTFQISIRMITNPTKAETASAKTLKATLSPKTTPPYLTSKKVI